MDKMKIGLFHLVIIILFVVSCGSPKRTPEKTSDYVFYPPAPDTARIQFLASISSSSDFEKAQSKFAKFILGEKKAVFISKPFGVSANKGNVYITDVASKGVHILSLKNKLFSTFIPRGTGTLKLPLNSFFRDSTKLYIADADKGEVVIFDNKGNYLKSIIGNGNCKPIDVFIAKKRVWITDTRGHKVNVYDEETDSLLYSFPNLKQGDEGYLYAPTNLWVENDKVYVTDFGEFRIKIFDLNGNFLTKIGNYGAGVGKLARPKGVAADKSGYIYVVDAAFGNVQVFNEQGELLMFFGENFRGERGRGDMSLPAQIYIDYDNMEYFQDLVYPGYKLKYLIYVISQMGSDKLNVYGFIEPKLKS